MRQLLIAGCVLLLVAVALTLSQPSASRISQETPDVPGDSAIPSLCATIQPVALILQELAVGRAEVITLLPPGASPHTYEPRPSDLTRLHGALGLVGVDPSLDGWASKLPATQRVDCLGLIPESLLLAAYDEDLEWVKHDHHDHDGHDHGHDHGPIDAHFWSDPEAVRALLPGLVQQLATWDPEGAGIYAANGRAFEAELVTLSAAMTREMEPLAGAPVVLFHPSWRYFLKRYGLEVVGVIEPAPGKEPSPRDVVELVARLRAHKVRALFSEPQLPRRPVEVLASEAGLPIYELDPLGSSLTDPTYANLITHNAHVLRDALQ